MDKPGNFGKFPATFKTGDRVKVWSLQSFAGGGFLCGEPGFIRQDGCGPSVFVCLFRKINGRRSFDETYEVYTEQVKKVSKCEWGASKELKTYRKMAMSNKLFKGQRDL